MKLIVGLGNPGRVYLGSRHSIGFSTVKDLAKFFKGSFKKENNIPALSCKLNIGSEKVILAMPLTFMNSSGNAVKAMLIKHKISIEDFLVICDDLDLELGRIKIRPYGSSAGHNGIQSIIDSLGASDFCRLRIGIGRPPAHIEASDFVLSEFSTVEKKKIKSAIDDAIDCCKYWVLNGITKAMNNFNKRSLNE